MDTTRAARPIPLFLTALVALFSALAALALSNGHGALAHRSHATAPSHVGHTSAVTPRTEVTREPDRHRQRLKLFYTPAR